ncbi:MAG: hypothetical protein N3C59_10710, partial [Azovibrio sp.]|nr:hypothetical protein [Azovibrio sp.]
MKSNQERKTIRLITAGKGGSGKTTVSATLLSYLLSKPENPFDPHLEKLKIFVVDADPAETLAKPLGWEHH